MNQISFLNRGYAFKGLLAVLNDCNECPVGRRYSLDKNIDTSGKRLMQICRDSCLRIVNGRLGDDAGIGNYTFQSVQGCSLIDYVLFPPTLFDIISKFTIHDISVYSDHAPIQFSLLANVKSTVQEEQSEVTKIVWDSSKLNEFRDVLSNKLECLDSYINNITCY